MEVTRQGRQGDQGQILIEKGILAPNGSIEGKT
jgi:hypothetical protein